MSAIVGILHLDNRPLLPDKLEAMLETLTHRGDDRVDIWHEDSLGFGNRLLWTTPESLLEELPYFDRQKQLAITADARIDNRDELIELLELKHLPVDRITDSYLILEAYARWGKQCLERLLGDFAFAIWDRKKHKLFCARDPMGVKPFYYHHSDHLFVFASEIKAILTLPEVECRLNELKIAYHLEMCLEDREITFYQDILRLKPAHYAIVKPAKKIQINCYWQLDPHRQINFSNHQEYIEAFQDIFTEAVRCRLRSAFPIGSTLSGGLDSSSIVCLARQLLDQSTSQPLHTFSAIFPSLPPEERRWIDERRYMDAVKALGGFQSHDVYADQLSPLTEILWQEEEAILSPNIYIHQGIYQSASQQGVRVILDGLDGDSTICHGWRYLTELIYQGRWLKLFKESKLASQNFRTSQPRVLWQYGLKPLLVEPLSYLWDILQKQVPIDNSESSLIDADFAKRLNLTEKMEALQDNKPIFTSRREHQLSLNTGLYTHALEITDKATAKYSLEGRYPFFDRRLMEFCLALPAEQKFRNGWSRAILRYSMTDILPSEVQWRVSKANLSFNFKRKFLETQKETIQKTIERTETIEPYVNILKLRSAVDRYIVRQQPQPDDEIVIFNAVILSQWLANSQG